MLLAWVQAIGGIGIARVPEHPAIAAGRFGSVDLRPDLRRAEHALVKRIVAKSLQPWAEPQGREADARRGRDSQECRTDSQRGTASVPGRRCGEKVVRHGVSSMVGRQASLSIRVAWLTDFNHGLANEMVVWGMLIAPKPLPRRQGVSRMFRYFFTASHVTRSLLG